MLISFMLIDGKLEVYKLTYLIKSVWKKWSDKLTHKCQVT